jgi:hypothetical protein
MKPGRNYFLPLLFLWIMHFDHLYEELRVRSLQYNLPVLLVMGTWVNGCSY